MDVTRQRLRLSGGTELSVLTAGEAARPTLLLLHGVPSASRTFRDIIPRLSEVARVIAPDFPGFGESDLLPASSFAAFGDVVTELLERLAIGPRYIYVHDFGAPVALRIAMQAPELVRGLIVQNANAHRSGMGPNWAEVIAYWSHPTPENEAAATRHLTFEGTRDQYVANVPPEVAARISGRGWEEDWRVMTLPGRLDMHKALVADYKHHVARFDEYAAWLARWQPPALLVWGRHDPYFDIAETLSWMQALPRMEAHVLDAGHLMLETHAEPAAALMAAFIERTERTHPTRPPA